MKQATAFVLATALVTLGVPAVAHQAAYPDECDNTDGAGYCQTDQGRVPAHRQCVGERDWMSEDGLVKDNIGIDQGEESIVVYTYAPGDTTTQSETGAPMPGLVWIEENGFSGLQHTDWQCNSEKHDREDGDHWEVHADKVLI